VHLTIARERVTLDGSAASLTPLLGLAEWAGDLDRLHDFALRGIRAAGVGAAYLAGAAKTLHNIGMVHQDQGDYDAGPLPPQPGDAGATGRPGGSGDFTGADGSLARATWQPPRGAGAHPPGRGGGYSPGQFTCCAGPPKPQTSLAYVTE